MLSTVRIVFVHGSSARRLPTSASLSAAKTSTGRPEVRSAAARPQRLLLAQQDRLERCVLVKTTLLAPRPRAIPRRSWKLSDKEVAHDCISTGQSVGDGGVGAGLSQRSGMTPEPIGPLAPRSVLEIETVFATSPAEREPPAAGGGQIDGGGIWAAPYAPMHRLANQSRSSHSLRGDPEIRERRERLAGHPEDLVPVVDRRRDLQRMSPKNRHDRP